jgi:hypothetical protein
MLTVLCSYPLRPGLTREEALREVAATAHVYAGRPGLIRKTIALDYEAGRGHGIYLWEDRESADAYYDEVLPRIEAQVGSRPSLAYYDAVLDLDERAGTFAVGGEPATVQPPQGGPAP